MAATTTRGMMRSRRRGSGRRWGAAHGGGRLGRGCSVSGGGGDAAGGGGGAGTGAAGGSARLGSAVVMVRVVGSAVGGAWGTFGVCLAAETRGDDRSAAIRFNRATASAAVAGVRR